MCVRLLSAVSSALSARRCVCGSVYGIICCIAPCALFVLLRAVVFACVLVFACASVRASVSARWCCQSLCPAALFGCVRVCECVRMLFRACLLAFVCVCVGILVGGPVLLRCSCLCRVRAVAFPTLLYARRGVRVCVCVSLSFFFSESRAVLVPVSCDCGRVPHVVVV